VLVAVAGLSHRSAPVEVREKVAFPPCQARQFIRRLKDEELVQEAVLLSTCNRTELYVVVEDERYRERLLQEVCAEREVDYATLEENAYWLTDADAVRHLYRVAGSLDSMVVGESQILGQVREAYRAATEEECAGPLLNKLFHSSLRVGKDVRSRTGIGDSSVSVPYVAVKLAGEVFGTLEGRSALVLGAGEMSELVVLHLRSAGIEAVRIANRTPERARKLSEKLGGRAVDLGELREQLREVDVVVSSTGSEDWVVTSDLVAASLEDREDPLFFIDIAVPRDVEPAVQNLERAYLYDIDDLQDVVEHNAVRRGTAAEEAEGIVGPAVLEYSSWLSTRHVVPVIRELRSEAEKMRQHEVSKFLARVDLSPEEQRVVEQLSRSLMNKLLHGPISDLKAAAQSPLEDEQVRRRLLALEGREVFEALEIKYRRSER
jgi:glutamyl-tRNA reductase